MVHIAVSSPLLHLPEEVLTDIAERTQWSLAFRLTCKTIHGCYNSLKCKRFQCVPKFYSECNKDWNSIFQIEEGRRRQTTKAKFIPIEMPIEFSPIFKSRPMDELEDLDAHWEQISIPTLSYLSQTTGILEWDKHQAIHSMNLMGDISSIKSIELVYGDTSITTMTSLFMNGVKRNDDGSLSIFPCSMPIVYFYLAHCQLSVDIECYQKPSMPFHLRTEWSEITNVTPQEKSEINIIGYHLRCMHNTYPDRAVAWAFKFAPAIIDKVESIFYDGPGTMQPSEIVMKYLGRHHYSQFIYPLDAKNFIVIPHEGEIRKDGMGRGIRTAKTHSHAIRSTSLSQYYPVEFHYTLKGHDKKYTLEDKYVYFLQETLAFYISGGAVTIHDPSPY